MQRVYVCTYFFYRKCFICRESSASCGVARYRQQCRYDNTIGELFFNFTFSIILVFGSGKINVYTSRIHSIRNLWVTANLNEIYNHYKKSVIFIRNSIQKIYKLKLNVTLKFALLLYIEIFILFAPCKKVYVSPLL